MLVARSLDSDGAAWGPFEMLRMQGYHLEGDVSRVLVASGAAVCNLQYGRSSDVPASKQ